ncbi:hypothetical protein ACWD5Q_34710 [Streptomyces sp. NPDC002513]
MTDQRHQGPGERARPIPRDMPDQQARAVEDPWDIRTARDDRARTPGAPHPGLVRPDHPVPDEPTD